MMHRLPNESWLETMIHYVLKKVRNRHYRRGGRPKPGTLLYSPSLSMEYAYRDNPLHRSFINAPRNYGGASEHYGALLKAIYPEGGGTHHISRKNEENKE